MRYRDCPTVEVAERIPCDPAIAWALVTDIELPARCSDELESVAWEGAVDRVEPGARFRGHNRHSAFGEWQTVCEVVEVEPERRWVWNVFGYDGGISATWGFEIDPAREGVIVRQWGRMGPGPSGLTPAIVASPELEGRIVARRLEEWANGMRANLAYVRAQVDD
ncbi:SRPBCC family protein [Nocardia altamirensis]|uniref:SRPBCC family protein n=1 Tax=Nocardia altamirensis TaxID=472158 RepID=UPI0008407D92|nr:SRPBCC family protein [Nocardia altamirensis]